MWEAFLLQMNEFDRFLEQQLRHLLDPVVAVRPPARRRAGRTRPVLTVVQPVADGVEPLAVTVAVSPLR